MVVRIGYMVHDIHDAAVHRRAAMMVAGGADVQIGGFHRAGMKVADDKAIDLGETHNGRLWQRIGAVARHLVGQRAARAIARDADVLVARNLESLVIAAVVRTPGQRLIYECLDLHRLLLDTGVAPRVVQRIETALLTRCDGVIVSAPAYADHVRARGYEGPVTLIENKLWAAGNIAARPAVDRTAPWRIAWLGMLRCRRSLHLLRAIAAAAEGRVEVILAGRVAHDAIPDFDAVVAGCRRMRYLGPYAPADLAALYDEADFAWAIDYYEEGRNSRLLLPNRLYESLEFGAVPIALAAVETGAWLEQHGVGLTVADPAVELTRFFAALDGDGYAALAMAAAALPREVVVATPADCVALVETLAG